MSALTSTASPAFDRAAVKGKQQAAWAAGDYAVVGTTLQIVGETLCEALDLRAGEYVLDVAAGNGTALWGTETHVRELFGNRIRSIAIEHKEFVFRYRSAAHWLDIFRTFYGPMQKAFGALDSVTQESLAADLIALAQRFNRATDGSLVAPSQYSEVVIVRR